MARMVKIAAVQLPTAKLATDMTEQMTENYSQAQNWLEKAGALGADIACLGEHFNVWGLETNKDNLPALLEGAYERICDVIGGAALRNQMYIIAPSYILQDGGIGNIALLFDRKGEHIGSYLKVHPTEGERDKGVVPGNEWPVFDLDFGKIGIMICMDLLFPESARCLTLDGAELIFCPHVMGGWGGELMDVLLKSPAIHNGIHFIPVSYGVALDACWYPGQTIGRSSVIGPDGQVLAGAGRQQGIALAEIDLDSPRIAHSVTRAGEYVYKNDMLMERRPDTYQSIVSKSSSHSPIPAGNQA